MESGRVLSGIKISRISPCITHLMNADDLVIYGQAKTKEAESGYDCLNQYCQWTGQAINWQKSSVHFSGNTPCATQVDICRILRMTECNHRGKYLGHEFCNFKSKAEAFNGVVEKIANKLTSWKRNMLSMAGQLVLVKSVVQAVLAYFMPSFLSPKSQLAKMDRICRRFLWGIKDEKDRFSCLVAWSTICTPQYTRGLGIRYMEDVNRALITKL